MAAGGYPGVSSVATLSPLENLRMSSKKTCHYSSECSLTKAESANREVELVKVVDLGGKEW